MLALDRNIKGTPQKIGVFLRGQRTIGATEASLWSGTAADLDVPIVPAKVRILGGAQDDFPTAKVQTIKVEGDLQPAIPKIAEATLSGDIQPPRPKIVEATLSGDIQPPRPKIVEATLAGDVQFAQAQITEITLAGDIQPPRSQKTTATLSGNLRPITTDKYTITPGGAVNAGDKARITFDGTAYKHLVAVDETTLALLANGLHHDLAYGTRATWDLQIVGAQDVGDKARIEIDGTPYEYEVVGAESKDDICNALIALINAGAGDPLYVASKPINNGLLRLTAIARGVTVDPVATWPVDGNASMSWVTTEQVEGLAAIAGYTVVRNGIDVVVEATAPGSTKVITSGYDLDGGGASTLTTVHTVEGHAADIASVTLDGADTFSVTVLASHATLDDLAAALAAEIDASGDYAAAAVGAVITIEGLDEVTFASADNSTTGDNLAIALLDTQDAWVGDVAGVTIDGVPVTTPVQALDTLDTIAARLAGLIDAAQDLTAIAVGPVVTVTGEVSVAFVVVDASTNDAGNGGVDLTCTQNDTQDAWEADTAGITLGGVPFTTPVQALDTLDTIAARLAGLIDATDFTAAAVGPVITIEGLDEDAYTTADSSVNPAGNGGVDLTVAFNTTQTAWIGDVAGVTLGGVDFTTPVQALDTLDTVAARLAGVIDASGDYAATAALAVITITGPDEDAYTTADACTNGAGNGGVALAVAFLETQAIWVGDVAALTLGGVPFSTPVQALDTLDTVAARLAGVIDASGDYAASAALAVITITGPGGVAFVAVDTSTNDAGNGGVDLAIAFNQTQAAALADIAKIGDGAVFFQHAVMPGETHADIADALCALIAADPLYDAEIDGVDDTKVRVTAVTPGVDFTLVDASVNNQGGGVALVCTVATEVANLVGSGIRQVLVEYLNGAGDLQNMILSLNGTTPVESGSVDVAAIVNMVAIQSGSAGVAAAEIKLQDTTGAKQYGSIAAGAVESDAASMHVPAGWNLYVQRVQATNGTATAGTVRLRANVNPTTHLIDGLSHTWDQFALPASGQGAVEYPTPLPLPAGARVWLSAEGNGAKPLASLIGYLQKI